MTEIGCVSKSVLLLLLSDKLLIPQDPFEISYNVARTVTKDGLYTLRGEFMRATRVGLSGRDDVGPKAHEQILTQRPDRAVVALAELCREREDELQRAPRSSSPAPRALSQPRGGAGYPNPPATAAWRSQSQVPFDRLAPPQYETGGRRGRQSEGSVADQQDLSAQELWLASQGSNLGNVGSLGLGFPDSLDAQGGRGRDTSARGLEAPSGPFLTRRSASNYDHENPGSGSISAPLSPHRLYAQLEMGKGPSAGWPAYDPRQHASPGVPMASGGPSSYANRPGSASGQKRSGMPPTSSSNGAAKGTMDGKTPLAFQPFSPPMPHSKLRQLNGEATASSFISPSTLLSPPQGPASLPQGVDSLINDFGRMGVAPPGAGAENDQKEKGNVKAPGQGRQSGSSRVGASPNPDLRGT